MGPGFRSDGPTGPLRPRRPVSMLHPMRHPELLPAICMAIAVEIAHLRWIVLTQWTCKCCGESHLKCERKPGWVKILL